MGVKRHRANHPGKHSAREAPEARKTDSLGREPQAMYLSPLRGSGGIYRPAKQ
jgi:hypothetical protein